VLSEDDGDHSGGGVLFDAFYMREWDVALRVVVALTGRWAVAEEICQEAFLRAYVRWDNVGSMDRPDLWVRRVAVNLARSRFRRLKVEARARARIVRRAVSEQDWTEDTEAFMQAVADLSPRQAEAVVLRHLDDLAVREIADVMGCAEGTVKAHLHAAHRQLRERMELEVEEMR
jgi:RNA polymerase sigma-70 factor, ECF subfamily